MDEKSEYLEKMAAEVTAMMKLMKLEEGMQLPQLKETAKAQLENLDKILIKHAAEMKRLGIDSTDLVKKLIHEDPLGIEPSNCNKAVYENCVVLKTATKPSAIGNLIVLHYSKQDKLNKHVNYCVVKQKQNRWMIFSAGCMTIWNCGAAPQSSKIRPSPS